VNRGPTNLVRARCGNKTYYRRLRIVAAGTTPRSQVVV
jgi:hypothetical protein